MRSPNDRLREGDTQPVNLTSSEAALRDIEQLRAYHLKDIEQQRAYHLRQIEILDLETKLLKKDITLDELLTHFDKLTESIIKDRNAPLLNTLQAFIEEYYINNNTEDPQAYNLLKVYTDFTLTQIKGPDLSDYQHSRGGYFTDQAWSNYLEDFKERYLSRGQSQGNMMVLQMILQNCKEEKKQFLAKAILESFLQKDCF